MEEDNQTFLLGSLLHQNGSLGDNQQNVPTVLTITSVPNKEEDPYVVEGNSNQTFLLDTPVLDVEYCPEGCHFPDETPDGVEGSGLDPQGETEEIDQMQCMKWFMINMKVNLEILF